MKNYKYLLLLLAIMATVVPATNAAVMQLDADSYIMPQNWTTLSTVNPIDLDHNKYFYWAFDDLNTSLNDLHQVDIVFHNVYNWDAEENFLNLYLADYSGSVDGWFTLHDSAQLSVPNWDGWTHLGTWSDTDGPASANDVVFSITGADLAMLVNGDNFLIGIDPDCHFFGNEISVNVPEPATMLLFGTGIVSLFCFRPRKRFPKV